MSEGNEGRFSAHLNIWIEPRFEAVLEEIADEENRSMSSLMRHYIKQGIQEHLGRRDYERFEEQQMDINDLFDEEV